MRLNRPVRDEEVVDDDAPLPGPIIIVPASKTPPALPAPPQRSRARERLTRAAFALAGAGLTLAATLAVQGWTDRPRAPASPPVTRSVAAPVVAALPPVVVGARAEDPAAPPPAIVVDDAAALAAAAESVANASPSTVAALPAVVDAPAAPGAPPAAVRLASSDVEIRATAPSVGGAWYHMDARTRLADSLVVVLLADGRATAMEQRWTLQRRGWQPERTAREGRWAVRDTTGRVTELCITWTRPAADEACAVVQATRNGMRMEFAGRYWQRAACVEPETPAATRAVQVRTTTPMRPGAGD